MEQGPFREQKTGPTDRNPAPVVLDTVRGVLEFALPLAGLVLEPIAARRRLKDLVGVELADLRRADIFFFGKLVVIVPTLAVDRPDERGDTADAEESRISA
jgi:hypothetical protein